MNTTDVYTALNEDVMQKNNKEKHISNCSESFCNDD